MMARYWAIAVLVVVAGDGGLIDAGGDKDKEFKVQGKFTKDDPTDPGRGGASQVHAVALKAGKAYTIDLVSTEVDSYLRLLDPKGAVLAEDDDSGGNLNSRILFNCTKDGEYKLVATTFGPNMFGNYTLTARTTGVAAQPSTAHARLIGAPAPDFEADFAVNGKPASLTTLRGKVVLLNFCDVRSTASVALLAPLNDWDKTHRAKGLAIVTVAFYPSDIGQALAFDKETGTVKKIEKADRQSDRALLGDFAEYHKIGYPCMALPRQRALDAYDAYAVNGVPQVVLIDRKGVVRLIDVGGAKTSASVEAEIKKLLEEK